MSETNCPHCGKNYAINLIKDNQEHPGRWIMLLQRSSDSEPFQVSYKELCQVRDYIVKLERDRDEAFSDFAEQCDLVNALLKENAQLKARIAELEIFEKDVSPHICELQTLLQHHSDQSKWLGRSVVEFAVWKIKVLRARVAELVKENAELNAERFEAEQKLWSVELALSIKSDELDACVRAMK